MYALDVWTNRGPFSTHLSDGALYFQLIKDDKNTAVPFVVKSIDVYNAADQSITLYVRKTEVWFYWSPLVRIR
ncbi:MAG TPA: hypothetical protein VHM70_27710 [Polyangiaceae bacterium]|nr:hypothetical protein [Polyangiaceae bacterium]